MIGAQFASRLIYPRIGPRRHITGGLIGLAALHVRADAGHRDDEPLAHPRRHVRARLDDGAGDGAEPGRVLRHDHADESMGRASTFFNTMRQVGSATGVAMLSTVLIGVGSAAGRRAERFAPDITAYHLAFFAAACFALVAAFFSLTIHDSDAAETIVRRPRRRRTAAVVPEGLRVPEGSRRVSEIGTVCVFCGSSRGEDPAFTEAARELGHRPGAPRHRPRLRRRVGRPHGRRGRRHDCGRRPCRRSDHRVAGRARDRPQRTQRPPRRAHDARAQGDDVRHVRRIRHAARRVRHLRGIHGVGDVGAAGHPRQDAAPSSTWTASSTTS